MADMKIAKMFRIGGVDYNVGYSSNDFTSELKSKLEAIEAGAQVNVIEKIKLNGSELVVGEGKMVDLGSLQKKITAGSGLSLDEEGNLAITLDHSIFKVVESLPSAPAQGDENKIHGVLASASEGGNIYAEYLWINGAWEKLGEFKAEIDLTPYLKAEDAAATYATKTEHNELAGRVTTAETKLATITEGANKVTTSYEEATNTVVITIE